MFYVLGFDGAKVITMTSRSFPTRAFAQAYVDSCGAAWRAFVVETVSDLSASGLPLNADGTIAEPDILDDPADPATWQRPDGTPHVGA